MTPVFPFSPVADKTALRALDTSSCIYGSCVLVLSDMTVFSWNKDYQYKDDESLGVVRPDSVATNEAGRWVYEEGLTAIAAIASQLA